MNAFLEQTMFSGRMIDEAGQTVAAWVIQGEESPGSTEQDAG